AILLARAGTRVVVVDRDASLAKRTVEVIAAVGGEALALSADVTRAADCAAMVEATLDRFGRLDFLDNNVGIGSRGTVVDESEESWRRLMTVNVDSMFLAAKHAIPAMRRTGAGATRPRGGRRLAAPRPAGPQPRDGRRRALLPEDILEQIGHPGGGIAPDLALLLADHVVEAVEGLADDVTIELVVFGLEEREGLRLTEQLVVLPHRPDLVHRLLHDRPEGDAQRRGRLALEVVGRGGRRTVQDPLGVVDRHLADRVPEELLGRRRRALGGAVHAEHELVRLGPVAGGAQAALDRAEALRHQDLDRLVREVAVSLPGQSH